MPTGLVRFQVGPPIIMTLRVYITLTVNQDRSGRQPIEPDTILEQEVPDGLSLPVLGLIASGLAFREGWSADEVKVTWELV